MESISKMLFEDVREVAAIEEQIFTEPWSSASFKNALENKNNIYYVAKVDGKIVGYCGMWTVAGEGDITNVAVCPDHRCKGIAGKLISYVLADAKERGIYDYTLEVRVSNKGAIHLYQKMGFESAGIRKGFYSKPTEDAMIMWKRKK